MLNLMFVVDYIQDQRLECCWWWRVVVNNTTGVTDSLWQIHTLEHRNIKTLWKLFYKLNDKKSVVIKIVK